MSSEKRLMSSQPFESDVPPEKAGAIPAVSVERAAPARARVAELIAALSVVAVAAAAAGRWLAKNPVSTASPVSAAS
jgi:hypothetical protein